MYRVPLSTLPNQRVAFNVDGAYWQLKVYQAVDTMFADIRRNGVMIIQGVRCQPGQGLMPYRYMSAPNFGNFVFDGIVDWTEFGISCSLLYLDALEFAEFELLALEGA